MPYCISFVNPKGGAGKSTIAIHLARSLQLKGYSVVILDLEARDTSAATVWFRDTAIEGPAVEPTPTMKQVRARIGAHRDTDFVIMDSAAGEGEMALGAAYLSDQVVIPIVPDKLNLVYGVKAYRNIEAVQQATGRPETVRVLLNRAEKNTRLLQMTEDTIKEQGIPRFKTVLTKYQLYPWAIALGSTALDVDPSSEGVEQLTSFCEEVLAL